MTTKTTTTLRCVSLIHDPEEDTSAVATIHRAGSQADGSGTCERHIGWFEENGYEVRAIPAPASNPYLDAANGMLPEARRLKQMARERFAQAVDNGDWEKASVAANAANAMATSIINMLVLAAGEDGIGPIVGIEVPSIDGDLQPASYDGNRRTLVLTEDGAGADYGRWHEGPSVIDEAVRYERWNDRRERVGHGYVHPTTRRLVQSG